MDGVRISIALEDEHETPHSFAQIASAIAHG